MNLIRVRVSNPLSAHLLPDPIEAGDVTFEPGEDYTSIGFGRLGGFRLMHDDEALQFMGTIWNRIVGEPEPLQMLVFDWLRNGERVFLDIRDYTHYIALWKTEEGLSYRSSRGTVYQVRPGEPRIERKFKPNVAAGHS